jgi:hypothetical protein
MKTPEGLGVDAPKPSGFGGLLIKKNSGRGECTLDGQEDFCRPSRVYTVSLRDAKM